MGRSLRARLQKAKVSERADCEILGRMIEGSYVSESGFVGSRILNLLK